MGYLDTVSHGIRLEGMSSPYSNFLLNADTAVNSDQVSWDSDQSWKTLRTEAAPPHWVTRPSAWLSPLGEVYA